MGVQTLSVQITDPELRKGRPGYGLSPEEYLEILGFSNFKILSIHRDWSLRGYDILLEVNKEE